MPLVYHALESDNPVVLEKALKVVPGLCEVLDYTVRLLLTHCPSQLYTLMSRLWCRSRPSNKLCFRRSRQCSVKLPSSRSKSSTTRNPLSLQGIRADPLHMDSTLICFHSMIKILDKFTLTEKLVPLLSKIKTKEPSVMIATLAVHEEMGKKCEVEASTSQVASICEG